MKLMLIGLFAFAMLLGSGCKKEEINGGKSTTKTEMVSEKPADVNHIHTQSTDGYPGGAATYPHSTGLCYCGVYSVCHPTQTPNQPHSASCLNGSANYPAGYICPGGNYCNPPH